MLFKRCTGSQAGGFCVVVKRSRSGLVAQSPRIHYLYTGCTFVPSCSILLPPPPEPPPKKRTIELLSHTSFCCLFRRNAVAVTQVCMVQSLASRALLYPRVQHSTVYFQKHPLFISSSTGGAASQLPESPLAFPLSHSSPLLSPAILVCSYCQLLPPLPHHHYRPL